MIDKAGQFFASAGQLSEKGFRVIREALRIVLIRKATADKVLAGGRSCEGEVIPVVLPVA